MGLGLSGKVRALVSHPFSLFISNCPTLLEMYSCRPPPGHPASSGAGPQAALYSDFVFRTWKP